MREQERLLREVTEQLFLEDTLPERADVILIPGNGFPQMAEEAARLWKQGTASWVLPSGRYSILAGKFSGVLEKKDRYPGNYQTEWEFLKEVLVENGVDPAAVLKEDRAEYTYENAVYSRSAADAAGLKVRTAVLCCRNFHAGRAKMYYQRAFPEAELFVRPSVTEGITRENWRSFERGVQAVTGELSRLVSQYCLYV